MAGQMLPIGGFDRGGVVLDSNPFSLQPNQLSDCLNVRFHNNVVSKITGEQQFLSTGANNPRTLVHWEQPVSEYYVFTASDGTTRRITASGTIENITKGVGGTAEPLDTSSDANYLASLFNGGFTYLVSDGVNIPQYIQASGTASGELRDLPNWNYGSQFSSVIPRVLRPFRNVLVAANMRYTATGSGAITYAPGTIRVSNQAAPGAIPTLWDPISNSADTASEFEISETSGIVDLVPFLSLIHI